ncbi:hypothetical protein CW696_00350 [ANME-2 cluster archaeon]|nr:MAG: hypothetical protein CW696_00350 [ANME-2 cluster archaeon]
MERIKIIEEIEMDKSVEIENKSKEYTVYFEDNKDGIPNIDRFIKRLKRKSPDEIVHAEFVKRLFEGDKFRVTDIEVTNNVNGRTTDVDIELNHNINLQIWHGASISTHNILKGKISPLGGVETNWNKDKETIERKLKQLPDDEFGLLICYNRYCGINVLPEWEREIPDNKAIAELYHVNYGYGIQNGAILYHSDNFRYFDLAREILLALGFPIK